MQFIGSLFNVRENNFSTEGGDALITLNANHPIYQGHFPGNPVTPGVCSMEIITQLIAANYSTLGEPVEIEQIKFLQFINPLETPDVRVELKLQQMEQSSWRVRGMLSTPQRTAVKVIARYEKA